MLILKGAEETDHLKMIKVIFNEHKDEACEQLIIGKLRRVN